MWKPTDMTILKHLCSECALNSQSFVSQDDGTVLQRKDVVKIKTTKEVNVSNQIVRMKIFRKAFLGTTGYSRMLQL